MVIQTDSAPYAAAWSEYRRRWRTIYYFAGSGAACYLLAALLGHWSVSVVFELLSVPLLVAAGVLHWRLRRWLCPRCGQRFFSNPAEPAHFYNDGRGEDLTAFLSWRCRHCRLPKWAVRDPD